jgi:hypothetical protein
VKKEAGEIADVEIAACRRGCVAVAALAMTRRADTAGRVPLIAKNRHIVEAPRE